MGTIKRETVEPRMLRIEQVAQRYGLTLTSIKDGVRRGTFPPPRRVGPRQVRWHVDDLRKWERSTRAASA